jgi:hypothetical protein
MVPTICADTLVSWLNRNQRNNPKQKREPTIIKYNNRLWDQRKKASRMRTPAIARNAPLDLVMSNAETMIEKQMIPKTYSLLIFLENKMKERGNGIKITRKPAITFGFTFSRNKKLRLDKRIVGSGGSLSVNTRTIIGVTSPVTTPDTTNNQNAWDNLCSELHQFTIE